MDWTRTRRDIGPKDRSTLHYGSQQSRVLRIFHDEMRPTIWDLGSDSEWNGWLIKDQLAPLQNLKLKGGTAVLMAGRAPDDESDGAHNPALLSHLPFSESTLNSVVEIFHVHGSVVRNINRGHAIFSRTDLLMGSPPERAINLKVYNCRSSHDWPNDLALSLTHFPGTRVTYAIFYGCTPTIMTEICGRIANTEDALCHPLLLVGIFTELERKRQITLVDRGLEALLGTVSSLSRHGTDQRVIATSEDGASHAIDPWLEIHYLKNGLENWKEQMSKILAHIDELSQETDAHYGPGQVHADALYRQLVFKVGKRINARVKDIICDYNEKIRECVMIMDGMTLATDLAHTRANIDIALSTKRDGSQMRSIALLTMIFLPATFFATVFSMTFFKWLPDNSTDLVSPYLWIYFAFAAGFTLVTVGLWYFFANRPGHEHKATQHELSPGSHSNV